MTAIIVRSWVVVYLVVLSGRAQANDTSVGGFGSDLVPLTSTKVRMKAEDILIRAVGKDWTEGKLWEVEADYTFENLTDEAVKLQVGFPEFACEGGDPGDDHMCDPRPLRFESMRTTVDGQLVEHRKGTIKKGHPWRPRLGQVWLYDVTFEPGRETKITHRYRVTQGEVSDGTALGYYVTRTGATWAGTIGHARFRIHVPVDPGYSDAMLTPGDRATLQLIRRVEDRITGKVPAPAAAAQPATPVQPRAASPDAPTATSTSTGTEGCAVHGARGASGSVPSALFGLGVLGLARDRARRSRGAA